MLIAILNRLSAKAEELLAEWMNEWTSFHKGNGLDSGSSHIQPLRMRDKCYPTDNTHAQRTKNIEEEEKSKRIQNIWNINKITC